MRSTMEALFDRHKRHMGSTDGTMGYPRMDSSPQAQRDAMFLGRTYIYYTGRIYGRNTQLVFCFDQDRLSKVSILWGGDLYNYVCQCVQKEFGKPFICFGIRELLAICAGRRSYAESPTPGENLLISKGLG